MQQPIYPKVLQMLNESINRKENESMAKKEEFVKDIANIDEDFAKWYTDIVRKADLADYADTKGCIAIKPYGYAIWENIQNYADKLFKETGVKKCIFSNTYTR